MIKNGTFVKMVSGDRDRVGEISFISKLQPDGRCEFHGLCDYCTGNVSEISTNKVVDMEYLLSHPKISYVLVAENEVHDSLKQREAFWNKS